ncbi:lamin-B2-like isoform X1, partial [Brachionus plicatilis]
RMSDGEQFSPNYFNSVYNRPKSSSQNDAANGNLNEKNELKEINSRLDFYINAVKDLTQYLKFTNPPSQTNSISSWKTSTVPNNSLLQSMKNLEKDLDALKQLYEEEIRLMKFEIEELSAVKNKYSLENFNLQSKLKDFVIKFENIKQSNDQLANELNEVKTKNNRLEYEIENLKLESEKPFRENSNLKKDLEDLVAKLNEKQQISDNEIAYRQNLESKIKEVQESSAFEKKIFEQETENLKAQVQVYQNSISELEKKLNESIENEAKLIKSLEECKSENIQLNNQNKQLEEQNFSLENMCKNLESVIYNLEVMKKSLEEKMGPTVRNQHSISSEINSLKSKLDAEETRLIQLTGRPSNEGNISQRSSVNKLRYQVPFGQLTNIQHTNDNGLEHLNINEARSKNISPEIEFQGLVHSGLITPNDLENQFYTKQFQPVDYAQKNTQYSTPLGFQQSALYSSTNLAINSSSQKSKNVELRQNKDVTKDLFSNFEKSTILNPQVKKELGNASLSTIDNSTVTEASYVGNVKIHEVNKNGYYIRLLNVSNTYEEDLSNYTIQQMVSSMPVAVFRLPYPTKLEPGHTITVWARTDEVEQQPPHTFVWNEQDKWGTGPECTTVLAKSNGQAVSWTTGCHKYGNIGIKRL